MTVANNNNLSYLGVVAKNPPNLIQALRNPLAADYQYLIGTLWVNTAGNQAFILTFIAGQVATWTEIGAGMGVVAQLTADNAVAAIPVGGNLNLLGTANQIHTVAGGATVTISLPAAITAPGSLTTTTTLAAGTTVTAGTGITATTGNIVATAGNINATVGSMSAGTTVTAGTGITATTGAITATNGNLVFGTAGNKVISTSVATTTVAGANSFGSVTLVGGTATVATSAVTANSLIVLWRQSIGATGANPVGELYVSTIMAGVSFQIHAGTTASVTTDVATDVSVVGWMIIN